MVSFTYNLNGGLINQLFVKKGRTLPSLDSFLKNKFNYLGVYPKSRLVLSPQQIGWAWRKGDRISSSLTSGGTWFSTFTWSASICWVLWQTGSITSFQVLFPKITRQYYRIQYYVHFICSFLKKGRLSSPSWFIVSNCL